MKNLDYELAKKCCRWLLSLENEEVAVCTFAASNNICKYCETPYKRVGGGFTCTLIEIKLSGNFEEWWKSNKLRLKLVSSSVIFQLESIVPEYSHIWKPDVIIAKTMRN